MPFHDTSHGETHYCCEAMLAKYKDSDKIQCCGCSKHECTGWKGEIEHPDEWWEDEKYCTIIAGYEFAEKYDMPAIISEANRRRDEEWREKLEGLKDKMPEYYSLAMIAWPAALEAAKNIKL